MAYDPEDVGSKPTTGTYPFTALLQKSPSTLPIRVLFTSGLDLVKTDHLAARSKLALRLFFLLSS